MEQCNKVNSSRSCYHFISLFLVLVGLDLDFGFCD